MSRRVLCFVACCTPLSSSEAQNADLWRDPFRASGIWKKQGRVFAVPSYYAFRTFASAAPKTLLKVDNTSSTCDVHDGVSRLPEISTVPYLDVVATRDADEKTISLFCVNRNLHQDLETDIEVDGAAVGNSVEVEELFGPTLYAKNDEVRPGTVRPHRSHLALTGDHLQFTFRHSSLTRIDLHLR
jgi:alpha-N-arabinofuranosidase